MKAGLLASGALLWAAPLFAQAADPLAPLSQPTAPQAGTIQTPTVSPPPVAVPPPVSAPMPQPVNAVGPAPVATQAPIQSAPPQPVSIVAIPKDWRGVFDAIDAGNWASARAGIAALPPGVLTPVAKAELYTAKGSPVVAAGALQTLIAQAPELPQADQLALLGVSGDLVEGSRSRLAVPETP